MYYYYKNHINGHYCTVHHNPRCGIVDDREYDTEREAKARVKEMNDILSKLLEKGKITAF